MQAIDSMVTNLRNMAVDMSAEISDQTDQLDRVKDKVTNFVPRNTNPDLTYFCLMHYFARRPAMKTELQMQTRRLNNFSRIREEF